MKILSVFIFVLIASDLFSQLDYVRTKNPGNDSHIVTFQYLELDSIKCRSFYDTLQQREIFIDVDNMPIYEDSIKDIRKYIQRHVRYPETRIDTNAIVIASFILEPGGTITNLKIIKGITPLFDNEVIKVIKNMNVWKAGECNGRKVPVYYITPVRFVLF